MPEKEKIPAIRFKGFTDAWEQLKLGEIAEIISGGTPDTNNQDYWDGDINWYAPAEISDQIYVTESERKITELGLQKSSAKMLPADKTILFTSRAGIGKTAILKHSACTNQGFQSLVLKDEFVPYFVYSMGEQIKKKAEAVASGSTFLEISGKMLSNIDVMIPKKDEQLRITSYFEQLDNLITLHQSKLLKIKNVKKAMLENMFPKNGSNVPEIRFTGFTDAWEQREAKDIFKSIADKGYPDLPVLSASQEFGMIKRTETGISIHHDVSNEIGYKRVIPGQFVIHLRSFQGGFAHSSTEGITSPAYTVLDFQEREKHYDYFWKYIFKSELFIKRLELITYGIRDGRSISFNDFSTLNFYYPDYEEERKIGEYFRELDNLITLYQRKYKKLQNFKKACLEKMFV